MRAILYLEDLGEIVGGSGGNKQVQRQHSSVKGNMENKNPNAEDVQAVYNLELWKRSEESKFKAYLKQKEIERIEEITYTWKNKEADREKQFGESLSKVTQLEGKLR